MLSSFAGCYKLGWMPVLYLGPAVVKKVEEGAVSFMSSPRNVSPLDLGM